MGIPVVFLFNSRKKSDYRVHIIEDLVGINYVNESLLSFKLIAKYYSKKINWTPASLDIEDEKARIKAAYLNAFETAKKTYYKRFM